MKTNLGNPINEIKKAGGRESEPAFSTPCWLALAIIALSATASHATVSEPDNILYGNITLDSALVTAARTDVVIEARRTTNGPAIASYRMGANPALGNFYSLRLLLESVSPITDTNASQVAQSVFILVTDGTGPRAQTTFTITDRGAAQRVDFGAAVADGDGDGLPDAWELLHFANLSRSTNSPGANGQTAWQNYLAGTDPNDPNSGFRLHIATTNQMQRVSFVAIRAEGPGYEGLTRLHTLESNATFVSAWNGVAGFVDVPGNNQTVVYQTVGAGAGGFFRGRISLQPSASLFLTNDTDSDGLPDNWESLYFGNLGQSAGSLNLNNQTAFLNFVAGNNPNDTSSVSKLSITSSNDQQRVSFVALSAEGTGYAGLNRYYSLEASSDPAGTTWMGVANLTNVLGSNQSVNYLSPATGTKFFRARVWLQAQ